MKGTRQRSFPQLPVFRNPSPPVNFGNQLPRALQCTSSPSRGGGDNQAEGPDEHIYQEAVWRFNPLYSLDDTPTSPSQRTGSSAPPGSPQPRPSTPSPVTPGLARALGALNVRHGRDSPATSSGSSPPKGARRTHKMKTNRPVIESNEEDHLPPSRPPIRGRSKSRSRERTPPRPVHESTPRHRAPVVAPQPRSILTPTRDQPRGLQTMAPPGRHLIRRVTTCDPPIPKKTSRGRLGKATRPMPDTKYSPDKYPCSEPTYRTENDWYNIKNTLKNDTLLGHKKW